MKSWTMLVVLALGRAALADEATYVFRSEEDPTTPPDPAVCAAAPFSTNVRLGASLWSVTTSRRSGKVKDPAARRLGRATACLQLTNVLFPVGLTDNFYVKFDLPSGSYTAVGTCTVASNAVPQPFIVLAGCTLRLVGVPAGSQGGSVTSNSIFNPLQRPGFATGSLWTLHEYVTAPPPSQGHHHHDADEDD